MAPLNTCFLNVWRGVSEIFLKNLKFIFLHIEATMFLKFAQNFLKFAVKILPLIPNNWKEGQKCCSGNIKGGKLPLGRPNDGSPSPIFGGMISAMIQAKLGMFWGVCLLTFFDISYCFQDIHVLLFFDY